MRTNVVSDLPVDWPDYIRKTFFNSWEVSSTVDLTAYAFLFVHHFDLHKMSAFLDDVISEASDRKKAERYHKIRIRTLANIFIESLLAISDDGKHITSKNIGKAKLVMEDDTRCIYDC